MDSLERRYAHVHPYAHLYTLPQDELQIRIKRQLRNSHGLLHYKHTILHNDYDDHNPAFDELFALITYQKDHIANQKLCIRKSHKQFLQSAHLDLIQEQLRPDKTALHTALRLALPHYPADALKTISEELHSQEPTTPIAHVCLAAAHDAHHVKQLLHTLQKQRRALTYRSVNRETQRKVKNYIRNAFQDELHAHAALDHQRLHNWAIRNPFFRAQR